MNKLFFVNDCGLYGQYNDDMLPAILTLYKLSMSEFSVFSIMIFEYHKINLNSELGKKVDIKPINISKSDIRYMLSVKDIRTVTKAIDGLLKKNLLTEYGIKEKFKSTTYIVNVELIKKAIKDYHKKGGIKELKKKNDMKRKNNKFTCYRFIDRGVTLSDKGTLKYNGRIYKKSGNNEYRTGRSTIAVIENCYYNKTNEKLNKDYVLSDSNKIDSYKNMDKTDERMDYFYDNFIYYCKGRDIIAKSIDNNKMYHVTQTRMH